MFLVDHRYCWCLVLLSLLSKTLKGRMVVISSTNIFDGRAPLRCIWPLYGNREAQFCKNKHGE